MAQTLTNLVQAIHLPSSSSPFLLITSGPSDQIITLHLLTITGTSILSWTGNIDSPPEDSEEAKNLSEAVMEGYLHLDLGRKIPSETRDISLHILPPGHTPIVIALSKTEEDDTDVRLFQTCLKLLERSIPPDASEIRTLRTEISAKDAEISHLTARLASAKATVARTSTAESKKKQMLSPQKKVPVNASALQPNQKR
ncbi:hypothetical protein BCR39DRAFT_544365 [Naematelia encephala]|uniref:Uncharacterized protein n=1 Tax=Naematelia encephala TaxID=71784 RepID=A0A1Y2ASR6_9TREE|nr:hypothetical protein BCR39DRAFT_544365 [Naematelia encephala]